MEQKLCVLKDVFNAPLKKQGAWQKFILPVELKNANEYNVRGDKTFNTVDYVFVDGRDHAFDFFDSVRKSVAMPTDYAIANGLYQGFTDFAKYREQTIPVWQRVVPSVWETSKFGCVTGQRYHNVCDTTKGIVPAMHLDLGAIMQAQKEHAGFGKINSVTDAKGRVLYHTIELGEYPQTKVNNDYRFDELLKLGQMQSTGKKYTGFFQKNCEKQFAENREYAYQGRRYVYVNNYAKCRNVENWHAYQTHGFNFSCFKVEPIKWKIENWREMPQAINPNGSGKAKFMDVRAENAMMAGIPFSANEKDANCTLWRSSAVRDFLNGSFVHEAFDCVNELINQFEQTNQTQTNSITNELEMGL